MGIPRFFSTLLDKFPSIITSAKETTNIKNVLNQPNPNNIEFHHLFIDLNGIIHQSVLPFPGKNQSGFLSNQEIFENVTDAIERLVNIIRPRLLLYIAIDGPAPLAKQQQQRQRRFFQAKMNEDKRKMYEQLKKEVEEKKLEINVPPLGDSFDSNLISPGTEFMSDLAVHIRKFIENKLNTQEWRFRIIFSDSQVPGEGEHKITQFIKSHIENAGSSYFSNTRHVIYGLDADQIFLSLSLHEPHTTIIRESVFGKEQKRHILDPKLQFKFLHIYTLREYLGREFTLPNSNFQPNFERVINDFIFICILLGNDFLPTIPTVDISKYAIDIFIRIYKDQLYELHGDGYIVKEDCANFNTLALSLFLKKVQESTQDQYLKSIKISHQNKINKKINNSNHGSQLTEPTIVIDSKYKSKKECKLYNTYKGCKLKTCPFIHVDKEKSEPSSNENNLDSSTLNSTNGSESIYPKDQEIFVGNLSKNVSSNHLIEIFSNCGNIIRSEVALNPFNNKSKGYAFITFDSKESADLAIELYTNSIKTDGNLLRITSAKKGKQNTENNQSQSDFMFELEYRLREEEKNSIKNFDLPFGHVDFRLDDIAMFKDWKKRYYQYHCDIIDESDDGFENEIKKMVGNYVEGLHFVLQYYLLGVPSWNYYYKYHRSPFCDEIVKYLNLFENMIQDDSKPFRPLNQLLSILPIASNSGLPIEYRNLQTGLLKKYYPENFYIDFDVKMHWESHPILPWINRIELEEAISKIDISNLNEKEKNRNEFHSLDLYIPISISKIPFSILCCTSIQKTFGNSIYNTFSIDIKPPKYIITSLLEGIKKSEWKIEFKSLKYKETDETKLIESLKNQLLLAKQQIESLTK